MKVTIVLEKEDYAAMHDVILEVTDYSYDEAELRSIWDNLPDHIQGQAIQWGCSDTVFRDNFFEFIKEKLG